MNRETDGFAARRNMQKLMNQCTSSTVEQKFIYTFYLSPERSTRIRFTVLSLEGSQNLHPAGSFFHAATKRDIKGEQTKVF